VNLAVNARYALANGGTLTLTTENIPGDPSGRNHVRITVADNGTGMTADTLHRVFEPFFTTKPPGEGTGMGLASSYGLITRAGGTIEIESELGEGTTVTLVLPAGEGAVVPGGNALPFTLEPGGQGERILLVEDDEVLREAIRRMLSNSGFQVFSCADGAEALHVLRRASSRFEILLTDVVMPKMLGPELAQLVRDEQPDIRILFMSGYAAGALGPTNRLDEGCDLLRKPFGTTSSSPSCVRSWLRSRHGTNRTRSPARVPDPTGPKTSWSNWVAPPQVDPGCGSPGVRLGCG